MIGSLNAARAICEIRDWEVSHLAMQKILYIAHGAYMAKQGGEDHPLADCYFQAWDYGPVQPDLYRKLKIFRNDFIEEYALTIKDPTDPPDYSKNEIKHIKAIIEQLEGLSPADLVSITHAKNGAWQKYYEPKMSNIIPNSEIYNEYKRYLKPKIR